MRKVLALALMSLLAGQVFVACAAPAGDMGGPGAPATKAPTGVAGGGWQQEWEKVVAEGKKEGVVSIYTLWGAEIRTALSQAFKDKYGINLEFTPFARGAEVATRAEKEKSAGLYAVDVFGTGAATIITTLKPLNLLGPVEPYLILPEVLNTEVWTGKRLFIDKDKMAMGMIAFVQRDIMYNTDLIKKGELTSYKDVLKPQYKGKITMNDPSVTGTGNALFSHVALHVWDLPETRAFLAQLVKQQEAVVQRDNRINVEAVARGKLAISLAPHSSALVEFVKIGAPVDVAILKEGAYVNTAAGGLAVPTRVAHPNATRVFLNWLLSKDGQTVFSRTFGFPSRRTDVAAEGFEPMFSARAGEKFFYEDEETYLFQGKMLDIAAEVMREASK